ncbi:MAG: hypothetical protein WKF79_11765 [Nocardioides sp.]
MKKHALLAASLVLVAGTAAGCGGGPPTDASNEEFCASFDELEASLGELDPEAPDEDIIKALQDGVEKVREAGTPEDMPDDAREGYDISTQSVLDLDADASEDDLDKAEEDFSDEEKEKAEAFENYLDENCESGGTE